MTIEEATGLSVTMVLVIGWFVILLGIGTLAGAIQRGYWNWKHRNP